MVKNVKEYSLVSEIQFHNVEKKLARIDPKSSYFNKKESLILPSLPKNQIDEFLRDLLPNTKLLVEPKIKGCAIAIKYLNGKFDSAISQERKVVTRKIICLKNVPKEISIRSPFVVHGEIFTLGERSSCSKRFTSSYLRSNGHQLNLKISFCGFQINNTRKNQYENLVLLRKLGFSIPEFAEANWTSQVETFRKAWLNKKIFKSYPTDGIVIKINSRKLQLLREKSSEMYPHWQMAINY